MEMPHEQLMMVCMEMISNAGEGRGFVHEALELTLREDYAGADAKLDEAESYLAEAHRIQFEELMGQQKKGTAIPFDMLLLHAMDLLMVTTSERDMLRKVVQARLAGPSREG
jgi:cellobiose-specific phosphotransferase system component IIA